MDNAHLLAAMTVSEFRTFKRAYTILLRSNVSNQDAIEILVRAWMDRRTNMERARRAA